MASDVKTTQQMSNDYKRFGDELLKYSYVYYEPSIPAVSTQDKGCVLPSEGISGYELKMTPLDNNLHTFETCKFGASVKFSEFKMNEKIKISEGDIVKKHGLPFKIVSGYFADNTSFFIGKPNINNSNDKISIDFSSLNTALGGSPLNLLDDTRITAINELKGHIFSIEWYGHFVPTITGQWEFYLESDDASYLWIGDKAVNDYTVNNAEIKNGGLHGMIGKTSFIYLTKEISYPIRIQFGENRGGRNMILKIKGPDGKIINPYDVLYYYQTKNGELYDIGQTYIALVEDNPENTKKNLFRCLIADNTNENTNVLKKSNTEVAGMPFQNIVFKTMWSCFNETDSADSLKILQGNTLIVTFGGGLIVQNNDSIMKTLSPELEINTLSFDDSIQYLGNYYKDIPPWWFSLDKMTKDIIAPPSSSPTVFMTNIMNYYWKSKGVANGDNPIQKHQLVLDVSCNIPNPADPDTNTCVIRLYMRHIREGKWTNENNDIFPPITVINAVVVPQWVNEKNAYRLYDNVLKTGQSLTYNDSANINKFPFLMSTDNRFKLFVNEMGNIKLMYANKACQNRQTIKSDNGSSLGYTYTDTANNELYLYRIDVNEKMGNINYLDGNKKTISAVPKELYDYTGKNYSSFGKYIPPTGKEVIQKSETDCMNACNSDNTCNKYYSYITKDGTQHCVLDNDKSVLPIPMTNNSSITSSKLMLKQPNVKDMTSNDDNKKQIQYLHLKYQNDDIGWIEQFNTFSSSELKQQENMDVFQDKETVTEIQCDITGDSNNIKAIGGEWTDITVDYKPEKQLQISSYNNKPIGMTGISVSGNQNIVIISNWWSTGCIYFSKKNTTTGVWSNFKRTLHYFPKNPKQGSILTDDRWYWMGLLGIVLSYDGMVGVAINPGGQCYYFTWDESAQNYTMGIPIQVTGNPSSTGWWVSLDMVRNLNPMNVNVNNLIVSSSNTLYFAKWNKETKSYNNLNQISVPAGRYYLGVTISSDGNTIAYCDYNNKIYVATYDGNNNFTKEIITLDEKLPIHTRNLRFSTDVNEQGYPNVLLYSTLDYSMYDRFTRDIPSCLWYSSWNGKTYNKLKPVPSNIVPSKLDAWGLSVCSTSNVNEFDIYVMAISPYPNPIYKIQIKTNIKKFTRLNENTYNTSSSYNPNSVGIYSNPEYLSWIEDQQKLILGKKVSTDNNKPPPGPMSTSFTGSKATTLGTKQGFQNKSIEPLSNEKYDMNICSSSNKNSNCVDAIQKKKIDPLLNLMNTYSEKQKFINDTYKHNKKNIDEISFLKNEMTYDELQKNKYKYSSDVDIFKSKESTIADGVNDDVNNMLLQQNNMYTLGTIATATIVILAIMISRSD